MPPSRRVSLRLISFSGGETKTGGVESLREKSGRRTAAVQKLRILQARRNACVLECGSPFCRFCSGDLVADTFQRAALWADICILSIPLLIVTQR